MMRISIYSRILTLHRRRDSDLQTQAEMPLMSATTHIKKPEQNLPVRQAEN